MSFKPFGGSRATLFQQKYRLLPRTFTERVKSVELGADRAIRAVKGSHNGREGLTHRIDHAARRFQKASKTMLRAVEAGCVVVTLDVVDVQNVWDNPGPRQRTSGLKDDVDYKTARAR